MRDFQQYVLKCREMLDKLKIPYAKNITFSVNTRAASRLGVCKKQGERYVIEIAASLLDEKTPEQTLYDTLLHELLHSCYGCMNHTGRWKAYAERVNAAYGLHISRVTTREESGVPQELEKPAKYLMICPSCQTEYLRYRLTEVFKHPERYRCGKCGSNMKDAKRYINRNA